jgi:hypothetical protein
MEDERIDDLLRALPKETASAGFTARVLARLDEIEGGAIPRTGTLARFPGLPRLTLPAAVLAATVVVAASLLPRGGEAPAPLPAPRQPSPSVTAPIALAPERVAAFPAAQTLPAISTISPASASERVPRRESLAALLREVHAERARVHHELRQLQAARSSTIYLGGDEDMDLVVHLDRVRELPDGQVPPPLYD